MSKSFIWNRGVISGKINWLSNDNNNKYKLLCPRGTQTCALAGANIAHAVYLLDVAKRPIPQG